MTMNKIRFILILFLFVISRFAFAQLPDGVTATSSYLDTIIKNYTNENAFYFDLSSIKTSVNISIQVHIIKNIKGTSGVSTTDIYSSVNNANTYFKNIGIHFFIDSIDYVNDYNYSYITYNTNRIELLTKHSTANKINLFLADSIVLGTTQSYGFTYFPNVTDSNFIFLDKDYIPGNALTTMLGHFMGLLSTHETAGGMELASEKNCAASGDFICDTYADPDLYDQVDDDCTYTGSMKDGDGKYYVPSVANIMSNSLPNCKCIFTPLQYRRMYYYYKRCRQYLK
jgi:hypothetical protein